jgi:hypothetical protein
VIGGEAADRLPWLAVIAVIVVPLLAFGIATLDSAGRLPALSRAAAANRRNSVLLLTLVGVVAATCEIVAVTLTLDPIPALWVALVAGIVGCGRGANRFAPRALSGRRARADPVGDRKLVDIVRELSLAADIRCRRSMSSRTGARTPSRRGATRSTRPSP